MYGGLNIAETCYPVLHNETIVLLRLFVLLYADDTVLLAENEHELQLALDSVYEYCMMHKLTVNISKTKILVFSRGKVKKFPRFLYGRDVVDVVSEYVYLGVNMYCNNKFAKAMKKQLDQGRRSQFSMLIGARKLDLPIDIQCNLFDKVVVPVLLYGCEVWGFCSIEMLEIFYRKFLKKLMKLRPSTPSCMVYGEVGKLPLQVTVDKRFIRYWLRLLCKDGDTLAHIMYTIALKLFTLGEYKAKWLCRVKCILENGGLSYIWETQDIIDTKICQKIIEKQIDDIALQIWYTSISTSSMCTMYRLFKKELCFEKYLLKANHSERIALSKYRCSNSKLPIYTQIYMYDSDICTLCNLNVRGDEYHYILMCPFL